MSYFDDASLVMIPSGYKTSKVYSVKPTDGSGDLTFSRSNDTATRVNSAGLIEKVRTNTLTQSGTFSNAAWTKGNLTLTAGQTDPNGGTNAFLATSTGTSAVWFYQANTGAKTFSIYAKAGTKNFFSIINGTYNNGAGFNLSDQTVTSIGAGSLAKIQSVGGGWYRCSVYVSSALEMLVMLADTSGGSMIIGDTMTFAFAQAETGDIATAYIATTSAAVSVGPVANVPRLDYLNSSCPRLLLEPQRTNLITYSEQINTGFIPAQSGTGLLPVITANNAISPDGYQNADTIVFNAGAGTTSSDQSAIYQVFGGTTATYTCSFYAKTPSGTAQIQVRIDGGTYEKFTITNEWQRFTLTRALTGTSNALDFVIRRGLNEPMNASATIQLWGVQVELGAYATSYIPTLGSASTRGGDAASKTSASALIGQTEGTLFAEFVVDSSTSPNMPFFVSAAGVFDNAIWIQQSASDSVIFRVFSGTTAQCSITKTGLTNGQTVKVAGAYKANDFVLYVNGVQVGTDNSGSIPSSLSQLEIGSYSEVGSPYNQNRPVNQALLFKTRLSNSSLAELTSL